MTVEVYPAALPMAVRSIEACSFHVTVSRRLSEGTNLSTYVKDTSAPAGGTTLLPYDSEAVRKVQNEPSRAAGSYPALAVRVIAFPGWRAPGVRKPIAPR